MTPATWGTRQQAEVRGARLAKPFDLGGVGVEFTTLADGRSTGGIDLDDCRAPATGELTDWAQIIVDKLASYTEISPSGTGCKVFFLYSTQDATRIRQALGVAAGGGLKHSRLWKRATGGDHPPAIEVHLSNRFFAVTDQLVPGATDEWREVPTEDLIRLIHVDGPAFATGGQDADLHLGGDEEPDDTDPLAVARGAATHHKGSIPGGFDRSRSADAFRVGADARREGADFAGMCDAIRTDASSADWYVEKGLADGRRELHRIWEKTDPADQDLILQASAPLVSARRFLALKHTAAKVRTLHHQNATYYVWVGSHYTERTTEEMRAGLYAFLDGARTITEDRTLAAYNPNRHKVANVLEATAAEAQLSLQVRPPAWLTGADKAPPAGEIIACSNLLLHLPSGETSSHSPQFFTLNALPFAYYPAAPTPASWLAFLASVWPGDQEAIDTLQELFGLALTGDTRFQKAFLIVGPKRSGKGTIARVLTQLLGPDNVCGPTMSGLGTNFGLAPLIGKRVAIISDARLSGKTDQQIIVERLLSITGEDGITIDRKFKDGWTGQLSVRFVILTNELPRLSDSSGALAGRFVILRMTQTFYGKEDLGLQAKLTPELPGILLWAIDGWKRLTARGHFVPPASSAAAQRDLEELGSPISAFLLEHCIVGQGHSVRTDDMYQAWCNWCQAQGRDHPGNRQSFGRDLGAAIPGLSTIQHRTQDSKRVRYYEGVGFNSDNLPPFDHPLSRDDTRATALQDQVSEPAYFAEERACRSDV